MLEHITKIHGFLGGNVEHYSSKTSVSEKGKTFRIEFAAEIDREKEKICCIKVDKGIIHDTLTKKCDFLFYHGKIADYHFVELKGQDIAQAVEQIKVTVTFVRNKLAEKEVKLTKKAIYGYIVSSSLPKEANQKFRKLKEQFVKEIGTNLDKATNLYIKQITS